MRQSEYILMMTKERSTKIVDFMTSRAGILVTERGSISHYAVKMHYFSSLLLDIDDTNYVYSHDDLGWVYQICSISVTPGTWVLVLRCGYRSHISEYALSSSFSIHKVIAFVLKNYDGAFLCHC